MLSNLKSETSPVAQNYRYVLSDNVSKLNSVGFKITKYSIDHLESVAYYIHVELKFRMEGASGSCA